MTKEALTQLREVHAIQGRDGCWDIDDYMLGLYNGLELALSIVENRACKYKQRPKSQPEQEPVAWMFQHEETGRMNYVSNDGIHDPTMFLGMNPRYALVCPLYTTPPEIVVGCAECGANGNFALYCVTCAEKFVGGILKDNTSRQ